MCCVFATVGHTLVLASGLILASAAHLPGYAINTDKGRSW